MFFETKKLVLQFEPNAVTSYTADLKKFIYNSGTSTLKCSM